MATISFDRIDRCILIDPPDLEVTIQEIYNAARLYEGELGNMDVSDDDTSGPQGGIVSAAGKEDLGGGFQVGITLELINDWRIKFADFGATDGLQSAIVRGGNLVATNAFNNNPVKAAANVQVVIAQSTSAVIINQGGDISDIADDAATAAAQSTIAATQSTAAAADADTIRKILVNRLELAEGSTGNWVLYDDDDSTVLLTWDVTDKDGTAITLSSGSPARRTRGA
jgi:hypothetical protein